MAAHSSSYETKLDQSSSEGNNKYCFILGKKMLRKKYNHVKDRPGSKFHIHCHPSHYTTFERIHGGHTAEREKKKNTLIKDDSWPKYKKYGSFIILIIQLLALQF